MARVSRRGLGRLAALALVCGLAAGAVAGYHAHISTGLRVVRARTTILQRTGATAVSNGPCLALPSGVRAGGGTLAFVAGGGLRRFSLRSCRETTLLGAGSHGPVRVSADGRWIGSGAALVTPARGGEVQRPLGTHVFADPQVSSWAWAPAGDRIAGVTTDGGVIAGAPGSRPVTLAPAGFGATQLLFDGATSVIVVRDFRSLWRIPLGGAAPHLVFRDRTAQASLTLAAVTHGSAVVWRQPIVSASTAADGDRLLRIGLASGRAASVLGGLVLPLPGYVRRCGEGLVIAAGGSRVATDGKEIVTVSADWRTARVGRGVDPTCSADGRTIAFAAGDFERGYSFGEERRRIIVVHAGRPAVDVDASPARGPGADDPMLSPDGRIVLWVQAETERLNTPAGPVARGALRIAELGRRTRRTGPIVDLGRATDFYGTWTWPQTITRVP